MFASNVNSGGFGWIWFLWLGVVFLMFSSFGNWGYTYRVHRRFGMAPGKEALDILNERYARGELEQSEYARMKSEISSSTPSISGVAAGLPPSA